MAAPPTRPATLAEIATNGVVITGLQAASLVYLPIALIGVLMTVATIWDAIIDPFIGHWSDTLRSRWGRRKPFLVLASPFILVNSWSILNDVFMMAFGPGMVALYDQIPLT